MKIYKRHIVNAYEKGVAYQNPDGSIRLSGIVTKPQGSSSDYVSIGKFCRKVDEFGDTVSEWHHFAYPKEAGEIIPGFKVKSEWSGRGAQTKIEWTFIVPPSFCSDGWAIALIGTRSGGRGYSKEDIEVILDGEKENVIFQPA
jgi:hypothetical protein